MTKSHKIKKEGQNQTQNIVEKLRKQISSLFEPAKKSRKILLLLVIVAISSITVTSMISIMLSRITNLYVPSLGVIKTIEVETYWDPECQNPRDVMNWGEIEPGKTVETTVYIKSVSNFIVSLTLKLTDWSPPDISNYITITWDYDGTLLKPGEAIPVTMNLETSSSDEFVYYLVENEITNFNVAVHFIASD